MVTAVGQEPGNGLGLQLKNVVLVVSTVLLHSDSSSIRDFLIAHAQLHSNIRKHMFHAQLQNRSMDCVFVYMASHHIVSYHKTFLLICPLPGGVVRLSHCDVVLPWEAQRRRNSEYLGESVYKVR